MDQKEVIDALKQAKDEVKYVTKDTMSTKFSLSSRIDMCIMNIILMVQKGKLFDSKEWRKVTKLNFFVKKEYVLTVETVAITLIAMLVRPGHRLQYALLFNSWMYACYFYNSVVLKRKRQTHPLEVFVIVSCLSFVLLSIMSDRSPVAETLIYGVGLAVLDWLYRLFDYLYR